MARDTVAIEKPACCATSLIVLDDEVDAGVASDEAGCDEDEENESARGTLVVKTFTWSGLLAICMKGV